MISLEHQRIRIYINTANALSFDCAFNLDFFEGPKFPRPTYSVLASRIRASIKTLHSFEDYAATLRQLKEESLPFCMCYGNDFSPGWDTPPFCNNLDSAKNGKLDKWGLKVPACSIVEVIRKFQRKPFPRFQGVLYDHIYKHQFQDAIHWHKLLTKRFVDFGVSLPIDIVAFCQNLQNTLRSIPASRRKGCSLMFIKTITNSWSTSNRYHEPIRLPCIFGCEGAKDTLKHYLTCDILWTATCTGLGLSTEWVNSSSISQRIGYPNPCSINIYANALMFKTYHALRSDFSKLISASVADKDFSDIDQRSIFLTRLFAEEMGLV